HDAIGHSTDLQRLSYDDLRMWYRRFYTPSNAVLTIVGDVQTDQALRLVGRMFGRITSRASAAMPSLSIPSEPTQRGERRVVVHGEGQTHYLAMLFRAPPATHPDFMPLVALDAVLCGASGLSLFGGGSSNRSSRLSRLLVDTGLLASINGGVLPTRDPYLYGFYATLMPGHTLEEAEARLWEVVARVQREGISADELEKAIKQTRAQVVLGTESASQQAFWLGFSEIIADHRWFTSFAQRLARVTLADVQRVAQRYLVRHNATIGWFVAQGAP
ncbi:MAG: insulinase family protein, partial [Thermoflexales bacterium]|nr:insulinase family protein [Thermoflexales bacterium]